MTVVRFPHLVLLAVLPTLAACPFVVWHRPVSIGAEPPLEGPPPAYEHEPWLDLARPGDGERIAALEPMVEIAGRLRRTPRDDHDVVIVIDTSGSAFRASGADVDGDGEVGQDAGVMRVGGMLVPYGSTDDGDRVIEAERIAALRLLELLDEDRTRVGLVKFGSTAWVETWLARPSQASAAIADFRYKQRGGTDIYRGIERALDVLEAGPDPAALRSILLLSDGEMTMPLSPQSLRNYRRRVLRRTRAEGVRIHSFGVGIPAAEVPDLLEDLAEQSGGAYMHVEAAEAIRLELPMVDLVGLSDVELTNLTSGVPGRAVRVFPDGSFDGYAVLVPGHNDLLVRAALSDGDAVEARLTLEYERPAREDEALRAERDEQLERLRARTTETDLARRAQIVRRQRRLSRSLEVDVEGQSPPPR
jgi:Mg-chelatase subunit ChlD